MLQKKWDNSSKWRREIYEIRAAWDLKNDPKSCELMSTENKKEVKKSKYYKKFKKTDQYPHDLLLNVNRKYDKIEQKIIAEIKKVDKRSKKVKK